MQLFSEKLGQGISSLSCGTNMTAIKSVGGLSSILPNAFLHFELFFVRSVVVCLDIFGGCNMPCRNLLNICRSCHFTVRRLWCFQTGISHPKGQDQAQTRTCCKEDKHVVQPQHIHIENLTLLISSKVKGIESVGRRCQACNQAIRDETLASQLSTQGIR
jgi:hypothetical protein